MSQGPPKYIRKRYHDPEGNWTRYEIQIRLWNRRIFVGRDLRIENDYPYYVIMRRLLAPAEQEEHGAKILETAFSLSQEAISELWVGISQLRLGEMDNEWIPEEEDHE